MIITTRLIHPSWKGFAFYPFIFARPEHKEEDTFLNHERIHLAQQKELYLIGFYVWYLWELRKGYRNSIFEREAYHNQADLLYLTYRKKRAFLKYLRYNL